MCRMVTWPWLLRPPVFASALVRRFSGRFPRVKSELSRNVIWRVPLLVGRTRRMGIVVRLPAGRRSVEVDRVAGLQRHDGPLPLRGALLVPADAAGLARPDVGPDSGHLHLEQRLDGGADLDLVRPRVDRERVRLRARALERQARDHGDLAVLDLPREGHGERLPERLLRHGVGVVARVRAEADAAAAEVRGLAVALARVARVLLLVHLLGVAGD